MLETSTRILIIEDIDLKINQIKDNFKYVDICQSIAEFEKYKNIIDEYDKILIDLHLCKNLKNITIEDLIYLYKNPSKRISLFKNCKMETTSSIIQFLKQRNSINKAVNISHDRSLEQIIGPTIHIITPNFHKIDGLTKNDIINYKPLL